MPYIGKVLRAFPCWLFHRRHWRCTASTVGVSFFCVKCNRRWSWIWEPPLDKDKRVVYVTGIVDRGKL